jgi:hypothetical protein
VPFGVENNARYLHILDSMPVPDLKCYIPALAKFKQTAPVLVFVLMAL